MNKFTQIALASAVAMTFAAQAYAGAYMPPHAIPVEEPSFQGFYLGVGGGIVIPTTKTTTIYSYDQDLEFLRDEILDREDCQKAIELQKLKRRSKNA